MNFSKYEKGASVVTPVIFKIKGHILSLDQCIALQDIYSSKPATVDSGLVIDLNMRGLLKNATLTRDGVIVAKALRDYGNNDLNREFGIVKNIRNISDQARIEVISYGGTIGYTFVPWDVQIEKEKKWGLINRYQAIGMPCIVEIVDGKPVFIDIYVVR